MKNTTKFAVTSAGTLFLAILLAACKVTDPGTPAPQGPAVAATELPSLGNAAGFAVFGGTAGVTNQGTSTTIDGDLGTTGASTTITGFHSPTFVYGETPLNVGTVNGSVYSDAPQGSPADFARAKSAAADALASYNTLAALPGGIDPGAGQLGGLVIAPGLYKAAGGSFKITGSDLTLDGKGDANAVWVFQMASALTVGGSAAPRSVILVGNAQAKNVYWQVGSSATINGAGGGSMAGTIIASAGISFSTPDNKALTTLKGRALALHAAVTMVNTVVHSTN